MGRKIATWIQKQINPGKAYREHRPNSESVHLVGDQRLTSPLARKNILISIYTHIHQHMPQVTSVRMRTDTKALLDDLKLNPRETYDDVVRRLTEAAYDDEPLTPEEIEAMEEGIADIKAGRVRPLREIMRELGDDKVIESRTS